ncbi:MAG: hypothetical protein E1N59_1858 [Puniceicoccaceae bacterium 5H]|nr:MAG: hypothetical protein E1N59_1858 [Puniceicoccaceae bacterium 5H]
MSHSIRRLPASFPLWWLCLLLTFSCVEAVAQSPVARILLRDVVGEVTILNADGSQEVGESGMTVDPTDRVRTGADSRGVLLFSNGVHLSLQPESELVVERFARRSAPPPPPGIKETGASDTRLRLNYGQVVGQVDKLRDESRFEVATPVGVAGIRGTRFVLTLTRNDDGTFTGFLGVTEGLVEFTLSGANAAAASSFVGPGQQVEVTGEVDANGDVQVTQFSGIEGLEPEVQDAIETAVETIIQEVQATPPPGPSNTSGSNNPPPPPPAEPILYNERGGGSPAES